MLSFSAFTKLRHRLPAAVALAAVAAILSAPCASAQVAAMVNGSEPIAEQTLRRFPEGLAAAGAGPPAMRPPSGLAGGPPFVSAPPPGRGTTATSFDPAAPAGAAPPLVGLHTPRGAHRGGAPRHARGGGCRACLR